MTDDTPPAPAGLTPTQALRWRTAARALAEAEQIDINTLSPAARTLARGRMRNVLADIMSLVAEVAERQNAHHGH